MRITMEPHNPAWAGKFVRESKFVAQALGSAVVRIHHIGSTAIPGIHAKPVIDMLVEVTEVAKVDLLAEAMGGLGYDAMGECGLPGRRYFRKDNDAGFRECNVHAYQAGSTEITRHLAFRDFMVAHPEIAEEYSDLKRRLAALYPSDIDRYQDGKDAFVKEMDRRALAWRESGG